MVRQLTPPPRRCAHLKLMLRLWRCPEGRQIKGEPYTKSPVLSSHYTRLTRYSDAGYLTEYQWAEVFTNCGLMHGWTISSNKKSIYRAPKAGGSDRDGL